MGISRILQKVGLSGGHRAGRRRKRGSAAEAPQTVGRYRLQEAIGSGSFGEVWKAIDPHISRAVAVKILRVPEGVTGRQKAEWEQRFLREARAAGVLSHPGIVTIHDVGVSEDGRPFIVMELVEGQGLDAIIRAERDVPTPMALEWIAQVAEALDAAHKRGIVHRDIKPANILIDREGRPRIADFGIARLSESDLTREGLFVGSPAYASPEQIRGTSVDGRSDLFSLGAVLYTLLSGERPFPSHDLSGLAYAICHVEPPPLRRASRRVSQALESVVLKALHKDPAGRHQNGQDLAEDLRVVAAGRPPVHARMAPRIESTLQEESPVGGKEPPARRGRGRMARTGAPAPTGGIAVAVATIMAVCAALAGTYLLTRGAGEPIRVTATQHLRTAEAALRSAGDPPPPGAAPETPLPKISNVSLAQEPATWGGGPEADSAVVTLHVAHKLPDGLILVWSGKRRLLSASLEPQDASFRDANMWRLRLPAGEHPLRLRVASAKTGLDLEHEETRTVHERRQYTLHVRVKMHPSPKLDLLWTDN